MTSDIDLWTEDPLKSPFALWRKLRDIPPVVFLQRYGIWALLRYREVCDALDNWEVSSSAEGITLNDRMNELLAGGTSAAIPPEQELLRAIVQQLLAPKEVESLEPEIQAGANTLFERLVDRGTFDAVGDLAQHLPLTIVSNLVGLPEEGRENMLEWAATNSNWFGPMNDRTQSAFPKLDEGVRYSFDPSLPTKLKPGGWAVRRWEAADEARFHMASVERCSLTAGDQGLTPRSSRQRVRFGSSVSTRTSGSCCGQSGRANLQLTAVGLALGGNARTGLEDTLMLRRGVPAASNAVPVERLVSIARAIERPPSRPWPSHGRR